MNTAEQTCRGFLDALASKTSVPGGGGAAAMAGALGIALCSMVGSFTIGKKKYAEVEEDVKTVMLKADDLRLRLLKLVDEDAAAFAPLSKAYAIPKDDPVRDQVLEEVTLNACKAPLEIVRCCGEAVILLKEMLGKGSKMLISDVGCGALLCRAAMESAAMNVFVNTGTLKDREQAQQMEREVDELLGVFCLEAERIAQSVTAHIRKSGV